MKFLKINTALWATIVFIFAVTVSMVIFAEDAPPSGDNAPAPTVDPAAELAAKVDEIFTKVVKAVNGVTNYTVTFTKQEFVDGKLQEMETIFMKHRKSPNCVYMSWTKNPNKGRETLWCQGVHDNEIRAHEGGFLGIVSVWLDPNGSMAMKGNRHPITDAGIWHTTELIKKDYDLGKKNPSLVKYADYEEKSINGEPSMCITAIQPSDKSAGFYAGKATICINKNHYLPTMLKIWDHSGKMIEYYTYSKYKINPGLTDEDFNEKNKDYKF